MESRIIIPVKDGLCTGRNGTTHHGSMEVTGYGNTIRIDCTSKRTGNILNAGFSMDKEAARKLALAIIKFICGEEKIK